jgi:hypothetical protein
MDLNISTYDELRQCVQAFERGAFNLMFLIGGKGIAKTTIVRQILKPILDKERSPVIWIEGGSFSAFQLFLDLYKYKDRTLALDDADQLWTDRTSVRLLKALCQTEKARVIGWHTAHARLRAESIPQEFVTTSRVVVIANHWKEINEHVLSLQDRGLAITFSPTVDEVLREGQTWFRDEEVLAWIAQHRPFIQSLSMRALVVASEMRIAGLSNWPDALKDSLGIRDMMIVNDLLSDRSFISDEARIVRFSELTARDGKKGLSRAQWFVLKRKLRDVAVGREKQVGVPGSDPESLLLPSNKVQLARVQAH